MYLDISLPEINTAPLALTGVFLYTLAFKLYISFYLMWASYKINYLFYLLLVCVYVCTCARGCTHIHAHLSWSKYGGQRTTFSCFLFLLWVSRIQVFKFEQQEFLVAEKILVCVSCRRNIIKSFF